MTRKQLPSIMVVLLILISSSAISQDFNEVSFPSTDDFSITADLYHFDQKAPTIVLFHQSVSSRGEYRDIAPRLQKMGFNCLAVDLRWGKQDFWNKIPNESARRNGTFKVVDNYEQTDEYQLNKVWPIIWEAYEDMKASIAYLKKEGYNQEIVVMGSSFSAMLVFKLVSDGLPIDGIAAFSPGEYHPENDSLLAMWANDVDTPVYLSGGSEESEMIQEVESFLPSDMHVTIHQSIGRHGASVLINQENDWPPLKKFLNQFLTEKKTLGFKLFNLYRSSDAWDGSGNKPINGWYWYPVGDEHGLTTMSRMEYVTRMNSDKTQEENINTFKRIIASFTEDTLSDHSITSYLEEESAAVLDASSIKSNSPLIVLSGAHPIYFTSLAEKLALAGYSVISIPRTGVKKGERLPFSSEGVEEYRGDLNYMLDYLYHEGLSALDRIAFVSWSFEGVPTLEVAIERGADGFISLDSSLGYEYGTSLISSETFKNLSFELTHYTSMSIDYGKDLGLLENRADVSIIKKFDWTHGDFTSLSSITIPEIVGNPTDEYEKLIDDLMIQLIENN